MSFPEGEADDLVLLALCILPDQLQDSAAWCCKLRELSEAMRVGPKSSAESEAIAQGFAKLRQQCGRGQDDQTKKTP